MANPNGSLPGGAVVRRIAVGALVAGLASSGIAPPVLGPAGSKPGGVVAQRAGQQHPRAKRRHIIGPAKPVVPVNGNLPGGAVVRRVPQGAVVGGITGSGIRTIVQPGPKPGGIITARSPAQRSRGLWAQGSVVVFRPAGSPPAGLIVRRQPTGMLWGGILASGISTPRNGSQPGGSVSRRRPARAVTGSVYGANAHGSRGAVQPRATVQLPRRYPARSGYWAVITGTASPGGGQIAVARSTSGVTDPRDGTATVTAAATSGPAVT